AARIVIVFDENYIAVAQEIAVFVAPFTSAHGVAGCCETQCPQCESVTLSFDDVNWLAVLHCLKHFWKKEKDGANTFKIPNPFHWIIGIGTTLAKCLRFTAYCLMEQDAILIEIVISADHASAPIFVSSFIRVDRRSLFIP